MYITYICSVATALQDGFLPYCEPVFKRCVSLVEQGWKQILIHSDYLKNKKKFITNTVSKMYQPLHPIVGVVASLPRTISELSLRL